jgi:hypothetical protein
MFPSLPKGRAVPLLQSFVKLGIRCLYKHSVPNGTGSDS